MIEAADNRPRSPRSRQSNIRGAPPPGPTSWLRGSSVIWSGVLYGTAVIPAKAGIQSVGSPFPMVRRVDSRFRGNDGGLERPCRANHTTTGFGDEGTIKAQVRYNRRSQAALTMSRGGVSWAKGQR